MREYRVARTALLGVFAATLSLAQGMGAQLPADQRWTPFLGCWEPVGETGTEGMLCVHPTEDGVEVFAWSEGEKVTSDMLVADARPRPAVLEGCEGDESSRFSEDGRRVFTRSTFTCGDSNVRQSSGIMSMTTPTEWSDIHYLDVEGESVAWVQHYRLASPDPAEGLEDVTEGIGMAVRAARVAASRRIDLADVVEANDAVHGKAVEAWIASRREGFDVDGRDLVELADRGVSPDVIDVIVAVSHPERFVIDGDGGDAVADLSTAQDDRYGVGYHPSLYGPYGFRSYFGDPFWGYGYYSRSGYGWPFYGGGYGWPYYGGGYYYPTRVVIQPRSGGGRVIKGQGYSQGGRSSGTGTVGRSGGWPGMSSGGSSSSGGGVKSTGSGSTGRTAKPRGGSPSSPPVASSTSSSSRGSVKSTSSGSTGRKAKPRSGRTN